MSLQAALRPWLSLEGRLSARAAVAARHPQPRSRLTVRSSRPCAHRQPHALLLALSLVRALPQGKLAELLPHCEV